jgi:hypothetical protein
MAAPIGEKLTGEIFDRLFKAVGEVIVQWGLLDVAVNQLAFAIFRHMGTTPKAQGWPLGLGYRLEKLKSFLRRHPDFQPLKDDARQLVRNIEKHLDLRDMLSHGAAVRYDRAKDGIWFKRIDWLTPKQQKRSGPVTHRVNRHLIPFAVLTTMSTNCTLMAAALLDTHAKISGLPRGQKQPP